MSLATGPRHQIRMAGTLWLPREQVKSPRPSDGVGAVITSSCHASLRAGSDCVRVGWHTRENKMKLFIQVYRRIQVGGSRSISSNDRVLSRCSFALCWVEFEKARFPQVHEIHLDRGPAGRPYGCSTLPRRSQDTYELQGSGSTNS